MAHKRTPWDENSREFTSRTYSVWLTKLYNIAISRFEWVNLPPTCDERFIEQVLLFNGQMCGFYDDVMKSYFILPVTNNASLNLYGYPAKVNAYGYNGYMRQNLTPYNALYSAGDIVEEKPNCALLYSNYTHAPEFPTIVYYARKLTKADRTINVNVEVQKTPWIITCEENTRLSVLNMMKKVDDFEPAIIGTKFLDMTQDGPLKILDLKAPFICDKLQIVKRQLWQEALTVLGVEANTSEKAERQVSDELTANLGETEALRQSPLAARKVFCDQFNKVFNTNIDVRFRSDLKLSKIMEGIENASVLHNDIEGNLPNTNGGNADE